MMLLSMLNSGLHRIPVKNVLSVYCNKSGKYVEAKLENMPRNPVQHISASLRCISYSCSRCSYYDTLGVSRSASKQDIKNAYIELSKLYHPDKLLKGFGGYEVGNFLKVREAFDVLSNDTRRLDYDMRTFGRSYDVNRFVSGEYQLNRQQFDDYEPFHVDFDKKRPKTKPEDKNDDAPPEKPEDRTLIRQLLDMVPRLYAVLLLIGISMYYLGKRNREKKRSNQIDEDSAKTDT